MKRFAIVAPAFAVFLALAGSQALALAGSGGHGSSGHSSSGKSSSKSSGKSSSGESSKSASKSSSSTHSTTAKTTSTSKPSTTHRSTYCVSCARDAKGRILRGEGAKTAFMKQTSYPHGRPGYVIDHIKPLACGGADNSSNMQWQTTQEAKAKDKWERAGCR